MTIPFVSITIPFTQSSVLIKCVKCRHVIQVLFVREKPANENPNPVACPSPDCHCGCCLVGVARGSLFPVVEKLIDDIQKHGLSALDLFKKGASCPIKNKGQSHVDPNSVNEASDPSSYPTPSCRCGVGHVAGVAHKFTRCDAIGTKPSRCVKCGGEGPFDTLGYCKRCVMESI